MNKKEASEIKKNFNSESDYFTLNRILTAYVDHEKSVRFLKIQSGVTVPGEDSYVYTDTLKKVLSTSVGKAFIEYAFPNEAYEEGKPQNILYTLLKTEFNDETAVNAFLQQIINNIEYQAAFAVISAHCSYTVRKKNKMDELEDFDDITYNYIITAICPVNTGSDGFLFDDLSNEIINKKNKDMLISRTPSDGFLFPVFSQREPDINHVMYYTKTPNKPNISIVNCVLGCEFRMSADMEKAGLKEVLKTVVGNDLDYFTITSVNEKINEVAEENKRETESTEIDCRLLKNILADSGVKPEKLECLEAVYKEKIGDGGLNVANLAENKTVIATPEITVNIKRTATDRVHTTTMNGRKCLLIDLDDPSIEINGLPTVID